MKDDRNLRQQKYWTLEQTEPSYNANTPYLKTCREIDEIEKAFKKGQIKESEYRKEIEYLKGKL